MDDATQQVPAEDSTPEGTNSTDGTAGAEVATVPVRIRGRQDKTAKKAAEKRKKALDGRISGMTWRQAAEYAGYGDGASAYRACKEEIAAIPRESAKELLTVELETLSMIQMSMVKATRQGDPAAANTILKVIDQRARFTGLYELQAEDSAGADVKQALGSFLMDAISANELRKARERGESGQSEAEQDADAAKLEQATV